MTDRLHLSKKHRQILETLLREYFPGVEVWAYGSRVNGRSHDGSDLDLVLRGSELKEIPTGQLGDFEEALRESTIPFLVEARDWARLPEQFHREIEKDYVVLSDSTCCEHDTCQFGSLFAEPTRNGLTRPKSVRGVGVKMVNMGELFANDRLNIVPMDRVPLDPSREAHFLLHSGDLLFARQSLVLQGAGKCSIFLSNDEPTTFESHVIRVRLDPSCADPLFYYYYWQSHEGRSAMRSIVEQGAGASGIRASDLATLPVVVRPIAEQRAIAHILGTLDDKIELNQKINKTLEEIAKVIFKSWFVYFDPVRAKAEGRPTGLPPEINDLFPDKFVESEIGEVPKGWIVLSLDEVGIFRNGLALQKYPASEDSEPLPVVKIAQLRKGNTKGDNVFASNIPDEFIIDDGDFIFSWSGSLLAKYWVGGKGALNQHLFKVEEKMAPLWFVANWVHQHMPEFRSIAQSKATTMGHIKREHLKQAKCVRPPKPLISVAEKIISPLIDRGIFAQKESKTLENLRDALLPKLISGELRITDAEKFLEKANI